MLPVLSNYFYKHMGSDRGSEKVTLYFRIFWL